MYRPNDIWINRQKKICGVLLDVDIQQNSTTGQNQFIVHAGVGINVNEDMTTQSDTELQQTATSLYNIAKQYISREILLSNICNTLEQLLLKYTTTSQILAEYKQYDMLIHQPIIVMPKKKEDTTSYYNAVCIGYTDDGYMKVRTSDNKESVLISEEVSIRPQQKQ